MLGLTMLVCFAAVGLVHLAVRWSPKEHLAAAVVIGSIGFVLLFSAPFAAVLLLTLAVGTRRLVVRAPRRWSLPDFVPPSWG